MTTHPATRAMVDYYAGWYDRHFDLEWQDLLLTLSNANEERIPVAFLVPRSADDLRRKGRSLGTMIFPTAGNVTHTPAYGNLIALGILDVVQRRHPASDSMATAAKYRDWLADSGRFLTFSSGGGYTALQRSALLNLAWDHISSGLDGRESAFELHANGGIPTWRNRLRRWFSDYNELANGVVKSLDLDMPVIDLDSLRQMFLAPRRPVSMPSQEGSAAGPQEGAQKP
jgi:aromatic ring hydroxylase